MVMERSDIKLLLEYVATYGARMLRGTSVAISGRFNLCRSSLIGAFCQVRAHSTVQLCHLYSNY